MNTENFQKELITLIELHEIEKSRLNSLLAEKTDEQIQAMNSEELLRL